MSWSEANLHVQHTLNGIQMMSCHGLDSRCRLMKWKGLSAHMEHMEKKKRRKKESLRSLAVKPPDTWRLRKERQNKSSRNILSPPCEHLSCHLECLHRERPRVLRRIQCVSVRDNAGLPKEYMNADEEPSRGRASLAVTEKPSLLFQTLVSVLFGLPGGSLFGVWEYLKKEIAGAHTAGRDCQIR